MKLRMAELLFVDVIRRYLETLADGQVGWLAGLRNPVVSRTLALLHDAPTRNWTLEALAAQVGSSRSVIAERFMHFIGQPPMQYLRHLRMQLASRMLAERGGKIASVAAAVGFEVCLQSSFQEVRQRLARSMATPFVTSISFGEVNQAAAVRFPAPLNPRQGVLVEPMAIFVQRLSDHPLAVAYRGCRAPSVSSSLGAKEAPDWGGQLRTLSTPAKRFYCLNQAESHQEDCGLCHRG